MPAASPGRRCSANICPTQLEHLIPDYGVDISVGRSRSEIPYPYVLDGSGIDLDKVTGRGAVALVPVDRARPYRRRDRRRRLGLFGPTTRGRWPCSTGRAPTSAWRACGTIPARRRAFPALRPVHQLCPLRRRVRPLGGRELQPRGQPPTPRCRCPADVYEQGDLTDAEAQIAAGAWRRHQMPAYHLIADGRRRDHAWSTSASARPTRRRSATISRCCGPRSG